MEERRKTKIIGEIGINFAYGEDKNLFVENVKKLIDVAVVAGCDYVKFQKRNPEVCVPEKQKLKPKKVPWNKEEITYLQYKIDSELNKEHYDIINQYCKEKNISWFASVWDKDSVDFMKHYKNSSGEVIMKIPSALINDIDLCTYARENCDKLIISTGMSTEEEIDECINASKPDVVMHTNSTYPAPVSELNLEYILWLKDKHKNKFEYGYSGHEFGLTTTVASVLLGAEWIERHITLNRSLWGSDQIASVEPQGLMKLVKSIRDVELSLGGYSPREVKGGELIKKESLRK